jgi:glycosyltransferase involved in cell wall biosynthesis
LKFLLLATRSPDGPMTGRKSVLRTIARCCRALGHELDIAVVGASRPAADCRMLPGPSLPRIAWNLASEFLLRGRSLNECLYWRPATRAELETLVQQEHVDLVIADMVRTAQYCKGLRIPWVLDLDDLLSERYLRLAERGEHEALLGYFAERIPAPLRPGAAWAAGRLLRSEARRLAQAELEWARCAHAVTLVSPIEARRLATRLGRHVHDTPMSIDIPPPADARAHTCTAVAFLGGLDYQPNLDAVRHYLRDVAPVLRDSGRAIRLDVLGRAPPDLQEKALDTEVRYLGYVDDVARALSAYRVFVAPIVSGTGIKTKVLEAMANGLAVVGTPQAFTGLDIEPGGECRVAHSAAEFAQAVGELMDDPQACVRMGDAARRFAARGFALEVVRERWQRVIESAQREFAARNASLGQPAHP